MDLFLNIFMFLMLIITPAGSMAANGTCTKNPMLFVFGDSNSDMGGSQSARGEVDQDPNGRIFLNKPSGRASDGKLIIDFLCENLTATNVAPFLNSIGTNFSNGVSFAINGAGTVGYNFNLDTQTNQLQRLHNVSAVLEARGFKGLIHQENFNNGLYVIDIGQNDLNKNYTNITLSVSNIENTIKSIYQLGGRNYWVHNTGPYGCMPTILNSIKVNSSDYDQYGCIKPFNEAAKLFNFQLNLLCERMRNELKGVTIVYVDVYTIKYNLIAYPGIYGFSNPLTACYDKYSTLKPCQDGSKYISWDGIHYTEAANRVVAYNILSKNYSKPPIAMNFFCVN